MGILYQQNFDAAATGALAGWTNAAGSNFVVGTTIPVSGAHAFGEAAFNPGDQAVYTAAAAAADLAIQISQVVQLDGSSHGANMGVSLRADAAAATSGYYFLPDFNNNTVAVFVRSGGAFSLVAQPATGLTFANGDVAFLKAEVQGTALRFKVWKGGTIEPAAWTWSGTNGTITAAGYAGLYVGSNNGSNGTTTAWCDDLFVGTPGTSYIFSVSPATLTAGSTGHTLTLTGTDGDWTTGTPGSPTFTMSSTGTGDSIGSQSITGANAATLSNVAAGTVGTITIVDPSTRQAQTVAVTTYTPGETIAVTDANWYHSPYSTCGDGAGAIAANNVQAGSTVACMLTAGAYGRVTVQNTTGLTINVDVSRNTSGVYPVLSYSADGGAWTDHQLSAGTTQVIALSGAALGTHTLAYRMKAFDSTLGDKWNATGTPAFPPNAAVVTGIGADSGATTAAAAVATRRAVFYGDSITEGQRAINAGSPPASDDAVTTHFCRLIAAALGAEFGQLGYGGTGFEQAGASNVPQFSGFYNSYFSGKARAADSTCDYVFSFMGTNGTTVAADVTTMAANLRTLYPNAWIFFVLPPTSQGMYLALQNGVAAANDLKIRYLAPAILSMGLASTADNVHPLAAAGATYGAEVIQLTQAAIGGRGVPRRAM